MARVLNKESVQAKLDLAKTTYEEVKKNYDEKKTKIDSLTSELDQLKDDFKKIEKDYKKAEAAKKKFEDQMETIRRAELMDVILKSGKTVDEIAAFLQNT